ncbi:hypothetical protein HBA92_21300 [Ochrobactrum sp. MR28]|nr:hypothetical protein [Ochrobactrum sp. MR28]MBX8818803.1 hypothetical protein [Ochrobactrum sp. MR31]
MPDPSIWAGHREISGVPQTTNMTPPHSPIWSNHHGDAGFHYRLASLGVSILVILPVLPNLNFGPGGALNPRDLFIIVVLVMLIGAAGHIATRVVGVHVDCR